MRGNDRARTRRGSTKLEREGNGWKYVKHYFCMFKVMLLLVGNDGAMQVTK